MGQILGRGIVEAGYIVEIAVVQLFVDDGLDRPDNVGIIHEPARGLVHGPAYQDRDAVGVAVQAATLVALGNRRQPVCRLEAELLDQLDFHGSLPAEADHDSTLDYKG